MVREAKYTGGEQMKYAIGLLALVTMVSLAGGEFATGGSEMFKFSGYSKFRFAMFGCEDCNPANSFNFYNYVAWSPRVNDMFNGVLAFDTKYGFGSSDATLKLCDAYLNMNIIPELSLMGGRFKVPFGNAFCCSGSMLPFYDRAFVTGTGKGIMQGFHNFGGYDIGANLRANFGPVVVDLAYTNGTDAIADTTVNKQFTARLVATPAEWLDIGAAVAMIGQPALLDTAASIDTDSWSATGMDFYLTADYPISETAVLNFAGEYMMLGVAGEDLETMEKKSGSDYYASLGATFDVEMGAITSIMPAVRYESYTPPYMLASGDTEPENGQTIIDFCLNLNAGSMNTFQIGGRNMGYEDADMEGYTDMYASWRMKI